MLYDLAIEPRRGFTGHEHLDNVGLIHMNGRVYDPILGRFTSPDTYVQFPETTQGFNRYTYVNNNPLSYTDPSGHFIGVSAAAIGSFIAANSTQIAVSAALITAGEVFDEPLLTQVGFAVLAPVSGGNPFGAAAIGFGSGFTASGGNLKAGLYSAATAATFSAVGGSFEEGGLGFDAVGKDGVDRLIAKGVVHGLVGGAASDLQGGSFSDGFVGAGVAAAGLQAIGRPEGVVKNVLAAAVIGGTASELSGGKFANGAVTAAFAVGFNECSHNGCFTNDDERASLKEGNYKAYYQKACAGGDSYACAAGQIAKGESFLAKMTTNRLQAFAVADRGSALTPAEMGDIRIELARGYANLIGDSPSSAVWPNAMGIAEMHWTVFSSHNVVSPSAFGGTPLGGLHYVIGPFFAHSYPNGSPGWCPICR